MTRGLGDPLRPDPITPQGTDAGRPPERPRRMIGCALGALVVLVLLVAARPRALGHEGRATPR